MYEYNISEPVDMNGLKGFAVFILASLRYETLIGA